MKTKKQILEQAGFNVNEFGSRFKSDIFEAMDDFASEQFKWRSDLDKMPQDTSKVVVRFDNGEWMPFDTDGWPFATVSEFIILPD